MSNSSWDPEGKSAWSNPAFRASVERDNASYAGLRERSLRERAEAVQIRLSRLTAALREIEEHHVEQNRLKGRDESRSKTLRIIRKALDT